MSERHPINYLSYPSFILFLIGYALFVYPESGNGNIQENKSTASVTAEDVRRKWDAEEIIRDLDHIKEDLNNILELHESGAISPNDSLFYFFRMHDFDDNKMLDGIELIVAVRHSFEHSNQPEDEMPLVEVVQIVDSFFKYDEDKNGFLTYPEMRKNLGDTIQTKEEHKK
ncbi:longistatin-like isoform X2 [Tachypleus tridentatus]|uniref:longistatin-like isoform X2 n=1 Tax=Tachypleus tridentatus TaxID=6853 RepID=UPI003FD3A7E6